MTEQNTNTVDSEREEAPTRLERIRKRAASGVWAGLVQEDVNYLLFLLDSQATEPDHEPAPQDFKWPKQTLPGYDYVLEMAQLNGFNHVTHAIVTAVRLRDAATRMRERCVGVVKDFQRLSGDDFWRRYGTETLVTALESLTLEGTKEQ